MNVFLYKFIKEVRVFNASFFLAKKDLSVRIVNMKKYEFLEHPADLKIRAFGWDLTELFTNAALAMMEFLYGKNICRDAPRRVSTEMISTQSRDLSSLLVDWLSEILYLSDTNNRAYTEFKINKISETKIEAEVGSYPAKAIEDIKAVTYNELKIEKQDGLWVAEVVFDI